MFYIISTDYFMCSYILQDAKQGENTRFICYKRNKLSAWGKVKRFVRTFLLNRKGLWINDIYTSEFVHGIRQIGPDDSVLLFSMENLKDLLILDKEIVAGKKSTYLWNPVSSGCRNLYSKLEYAIFMHTLNMGVYTFDPRDARVYRFQFASQVYRAPRNMVAEELTGGGGLFYIGKDKGRSQELARLSALFRKENIALDWYIMASKKTKRQQSIIDFYHDQPLNYTEVQKHIRKSECLLEILQKGQSGITLRTMEALFFGKKLITNNKAVRNADFYHPDNILVYDRNTEASVFSAFLSRPYIPVATTLLSKYEIGNWIQQFR